MAIREMVTCTRCGKTEPVTFRTRIGVRRLLFREHGTRDWGAFGVETGVFTKSIDLCESCWKDFEEFVYEYKED